MVIIIPLRPLWSGLFIFLTLLMLTGCPGEGDRLYPDETTQVSRMGEDICFRVPDAQDYQPIFIAINPRGTPPKEQTFTSKPKLTISDGQLCIPPSFYPFSTNGQFIVEYILSSPKYKNKSRSVVVGVEVMNNRIYNMPLRDREILK